MRLQSTPWPKAPIQGRKYYACWLCGKTYTYYELQFDAGAVEPTVGETLTGASSGDTGVVVSVTLESGTYAAGTAVGTVELSSVTGASSDDQLEAFEDNESITGSTGGAGMMTTNGEARKKVYGRLYPDTELAFRDGHYYCRDHYEYKYRIEDRADWARNDRLIEEDD